MIVAVSGLAGALMADDLLVVHEWGTFTSLQDEAGRALGGTESWPVTDSNVWLAPRGVAAATVTAAQIDKPAQTDSEKYLFYRGIGRLNAPLTVRRDRDALTIRPADDLEPVKGFPIGTLWLVEVREDQALAFRELDGRALLTSPRGVLKTAAAFAPSDFAAGNLRRLREALHKALVADGLFADEAYALLNTWDQSYFKTAGQQFFYLVPRAWTDYHLPLELSVPAQVARVMVARMELVTPGQRTLPEAVVAGRSAQDQRLQAAAAEAYRRLGRFRDALIAGHDRRSSSPGPATRQPAAGRPEPTRSGVYTP